MYLIQSRVVWSLLVEMQCLVDLRAVRCLLRGLQGV